MCAKYTAPDNTLESKHELDMYKEYGDVFFLTEFPYHTSPFWNMKQREKKGIKGVSIANKCDVIIGGMSEISDMVELINEFKDKLVAISDGEYYALLYNLFGQERVLKELDEFLSYDFFPRFGGGIGITRMISGMKKAGLLE